MTKNHDIYKRTAISLSFAQETATFSPCMRYRYTLWRRWQAGDRYVNFICLNPSTATDTVDDNTIRKCIKFARTWGYDAMCVTNIFAWRDTDPKGMKAAAEPVGAENDRYILETARNASLVIASWSQHGKYLDRANHVRSMLDIPLYVLRMSKAKDGQPWHPLYLPDTSKPILWAAIC